MAVLTVEEVNSNGGTLFREEYMYQVRQCKDCGKDFVLCSHDNPQYDCPRVLEFCDTCDECL